MPRTSVISLALARARSRRHGPRSRHLPAALLGLAVLGVAVPAGAGPAWAAAPATGHIVVKQSGISHSYSCGSGDTVVVNGSGDRLMFTKTCSTLTVTGTGDTLMLNLVSSITLTSASKDDYVCWDKGSPAIHNSGKQNITANCHAKVAGRG
jgi:hypothetical protein